MNSNNAQQSSKLYSISDITQLVELNEGLVNFKLAFTVESPNGNPFDLVVASQSLLDSQGPPSFRSVENGSIAGEIVADKNIRDTYFLLLRAHEPMNVQVSLELTPLPDFVEQPLPPQPEPEPQPVDEPWCSPEMKRFLMVTVGVAVVVGGFIYYNTGKKESKETAQNKESLLERLKSVPLE